MYLFISRFTFIRPFDHMITITGGFLCSFVVYDSEMKGSALSCPTFCYINSSIPLLLYFIHMLFYNSLVCYRNKNFSNLKSNSSCGWQKNGAGQQIWRGCNIYGAGAKHGAGEKYGISKKYNFCATLPYFAPAPYTLPLRHEFAPAPPPRLGGMHTLLPYP